MELKEFYKLHMKMPFAINDVVDHRLSKNRGIVINVITGVRDPLTVVVWHSPAPNPELGQSVYGWDAELILKKVDEWDSDLVLEA